MKNLFWLALPAFLLVVPFFAAGFESASIYTSGGALVPMQPITGVQRGYAQSGLDGFDANARTLPGLVKSFLGDELVRAHVRLRDGSTVIVSVRTAGGQFKDADFLGSVDAQGEEIVKRESSFTRGSERISYTAALYIDQDTVEKIAFSPNPQAEFVSQWGKGIRFEGLTFGSGLKTFLLNLGVYAYSFFVPRGPGTVAGGEVCPVDEGDFDYCSKGKPIRISAAYGVSSEKFAGLCDDLKEASPASPNLAQTNCEFSNTYCIDTTPKFDKEKCECDCSASVKDLKVSVAISQDLPSWGGGGYGNSTAKQKAEWDRFLKNVRTHEDGHSKICNDGVAKVTKKADSPTGKASAKTCKAACEAAAKQVEEALATGFSEGVAGVDAENDKYDSDTGHGATQGATLDCSVK